MAVRATFEELVREGAAEPVAGWDFSWLAGRATEERPRWGYSGLLAAAISGAGAVLDVQTGGGEVLAAAIRRPPPRLAATESWPPNVALARQRLGPLGGTVSQVEHAFGTSLKTYSYRGRNLRADEHRVTVAKAWPSRRRGRREGVVVEKAAAI